MRRLAAAAAILLVSVAAHAQSLGALPAWLQDLGLTTAQQDAIFRIFYEQAPAIRSRLVAARDRRLQASASAAKIGVLERIDQQRAADPRLANLMLLPLASGGDSRPMKPPAGGRG